MVSTRTSNYDFNTQFTHTTNTMTPTNKIIPENTIIDFDNTPQHPRKTYNLRARTNKKTIKNEVQNYISSLSQSHTTKYNLRSSRQTTPRVNYYRFYTSHPDEYSQYNLVRRSPRIQSMTTPRPNYCEGDDSY